MEFDEITTSDPSLEIHMDIFIYKGELCGELSTSDEIEDFMWFGIDDDINLLSNTLKNEIIPYAIKNKLIYYSYMKKQTKLSLLLLFSLLDISIY